MARARLDIAVVGQDLATNILRNIAGTVRQVAQQITQANQQAAQSFQQMNNAVQQTQMFGSRLYSLINGLMFAFAAARGEIIGMAFSLMFLNTALLPIFAIGALIGALGHVTAATITASAQMEQYRKQLQAVIPDAKQAEAAFQWAKQFAETTPFGLQDVIEALIMAQSIGIPAAQVMQSVADAAFAMNKTLLYTMNTLADAQVGIFRQLQQFGVEVITEGDKVIFQYVNKAGEHLEKVVQKFNRAQTTQAIIEIFQEKFGGAAEGAMDTISGSFEKLKDATFNLFSTLGTFVAPVVRFVLQQFANAVNFLNRLFTVVANSQVVQDLRQALAALRAELQPYLPLLRDVGRALLSIPVIVFVMTLRLLTAVVNAAAEALRRFRDVLRSVADLIKPVINYINQFFVALSKLRPSELAQKFKDFVLNLPSIIFSFISDLLDKIRENWPQWFEAFKSAIATAWEQIKKWIPVLFELARLVVSPVIAIVPKALDIIWNIAGDITQWIARKVLDFIGENPLVNIPLLTLAITAISLVWPRRIVDAALVFTLAAQIIEEIQQFGPTVAPAIAAALLTALFVPRALGRGPWATRFAVAVVALLLDEIVQVAMQAPDEYWSLIAGIVLSALAIGMVRKLPIGGLPKVLLGIFALGVIDGIVTELQNAINTQDWSFVGSIFGMAIAGAIALSLGLPVLQVALATVAGALIGNLVGRIYEAIVNQDWLELAKAIGGILIGIAVAALLFTAGAPVTIIAAAAVFAAAFGDIVFQAIGGILIELATAISNFLASIVAGIFGSLASTILGLIERLPLGSEVQSKVREWKAAIDQELQDLPHVFQRNADESVKRLSTTFENSKREVVDRVRGITSGVTSLFDDMKTRSNQSVDGMVNHAQNRFPTWEAVATNTMVNARNNVQRALNDLTGDFNVFNTNVNQAIAQFENSTNTAFMNFSARTMQLGTVDLPGLSQNFANYTTQSQTITSTNFQQMQTVVDSTTGSMSQSVDQQMAKVMESFIRAKDTTWKIVDQDVRNTMNVFQDIVYDKTTAIINDLNRAFDRIKQMVREVIDQLNSIPREIVTIHRIITVHETVGSAEPRQHGGSVFRNRPYLVGERGPELFVPRMDGEIIPHHELGALLRQGGAGSSIATESNVSITVNIDRPMVLDRQMIRILANEVGNEIADKILMNRRVTPAVF